MKVYVSGRIKDYPEYKEHFATACMKVELSGNEWVNPCDVELAPLEESYENYMKADIALLLGCDAIYMLDGWEKSAGARTEHLVAAMCGLQMMYENPGWIG
jgi:hypothetical protein